MSLHLCDFAGFSIKKTILENGVWGERPLPYLTNCQMTITDSKVSDNFEHKSVLLLSAGSEEFIFTTGDADNDVDYALEIVLCSMLCEERCSVLLDSSIGTVQCQIHLSKFKNSSLLPNWPPPLALEVVIKYKQHGVTLYQEGRVTDAFKHFSKALKILVLTETKDPNLYSILCSNLAACQLGKTNYHYALELCNEALEHNPNNCKAFYRRASAAMNLNKYEQAQSDLKALLIIEPKNTQALLLLAQVKLKLKESDKSYEQMVKKMFA